MTVIVKLWKFLRPKLDVLFVALNPPVESNENGHYFSGRNSRFFELLNLSGLITAPVPKETADQIVFGSTAINYKGCEFGIVDLVGHLVETRSSRVQPTPEDVMSLLGVIRQSEPRFVCIIHSKVRDVLNRHPDIARPLNYGMCRRALAGSKSAFVLNYFPNGNNIPDERKVEIFRALRDAL